jgi:Ca2+-binding EF-hand superfamily protein
MRRAVLSVLMAAGLVPWLLSAEDRPKLANPGSTAALPRDIQDLIYFAESRPRLLRCHIRIDGKPFRDAWDDFLTALFQHVDRDGNGVLSQAEIDRAPEPQFLLQLLRGNVLASPAMMTANAPSAPEMSMKLVPGKVTRNGLARYYRLSGVEPFLAFFHDQSQRTELLTNALFRHLDLDRDGKLSKEELLRAAATLHKLDRIEDEVIDTEEILPGGEMIQPGMPGPQDKVQVLSDSAPFFAASPDEGATGLAFALLQHYDRDKNQKLSPGEIQIDRRVFDLLDLDHDGELDARELARLPVHLPPDLELMVQFDSQGDNLYLARADQPLVAITSRGPDGSLATVAGSVRISIHASGGLAARFRSIRESLLKQFAAAAGKQDYLEKKQAEKNPMLDSLFAAADRNQDGKLTRGELTAYIDLLGKGARGCAVLMVTDHGRGLFELLGARHDGRLRQAELQDVWSRLAPWDLNHDGCIARDEVPQQFDLLISQAQLSGALPFGDAPAAEAAASETRPAPAGGPVWFRKMDRNGDGFVSLREFLGSRESFDRIDTNKDGLISLEEAEAEETRSRTEKEKHAGKK